MKNRLLLIPGILLYLVIVLGLVFSLIMCAPSFIIWIFTGWYFPKWYLKNVTHTINKLENNIDLHIN